MLALVAYVSFPVMFGLAAVADPLVRLLLTDTWASMIVPFQILCLAFTFPPISSLCKTLILSYGDSRGNLYIQMVSKGIGVLLLVVLIAKGVNAICLGVVCSSIIVYLLYIIESLRFIRLKWTFIISDMLFPLLLSIVMFFSVSSVMSVTSNLYIKLTLGIPTGFLVYLLSSIIFKPNGWKVLLESAKSL